MLAYANFMKSALPVFRTQKRLDDFFESQPTLKAMLQTRGYKATVVHYLRCEMTGGWTDENGLDDDDDDDDDWDETEKDAAIEAKRGGTKGKSTVSCVCPILPVRASLPMTSPTNTVRAGAVSLEQVHHVDVAEFRHLVELAKVRHVVGIEEGRHAIDFEEEQPIDFDELPRAGDVETDRSTIYFKGEPCGIDLDEESWQRFYFPEGEQPVDLQDLRLAIYLEAIYLDAIYLDAIYLGEKQHAIVLEEDQ
ncbi:hypothetical protein JCM16303_006898 [Sporobolomyces ruberrimus]